jgi:hypothetical protein
MMVKLRQICMAAFAALVALAVASTSASALQWLLNGKPITTATTITSSFTWLLADLAAPAGGTYLICEDTYKGLVGPGARDQISTMQVTDCEFQEGKSGTCEALAGVVAKVINLPWLSLLLEAGGQIRDDWIARPGSGPPGLTIECRMEGIIRGADECTSETLSPQVVNLATGVDEIFEASGVGDCTEGTATSWMTIGTDLIENPRGTTISVSNSPNK